MGPTRRPFEQAAATLLLHGHDPYGPSLLGALSHFRVPIQYATMTLNGGTVSTFGYPPVSLLVTAAAVWLTGGTQAVPIADDVVVLAIAAIAMFWLLPRPMRALAVLATVGIPLLFGFAASGVNAIVCMTLLLPVAHRWSSIGASGRLTAGQRATGVALGLAVATQQLAWFMAPFVLVAVLLLRRDQLGTRRGLRRGHGLRRVGRRRLRGGRPPLHPVEPGGVAARRRGAAQPARDPLRTGASSI